MLTSAETYYLKELLTLFFFCSQRDHMGVFAVSNTTPSGLSKTVVSFAQNFFRLLGKRGKVAKNG